jgi:hypothetical protein
MALQFLMSGGNFIATVGVNGAAGVWASGSGGWVIVQATPGGSIVGDSYWHQSASPSSPVLITPALGAGGWSGLIAGCRMNVAALSNNQALIRFLDAANNAQCDVRMNAAGQLFFTRNGIVISSNSSFALTAVSDFYIEFKAIFSTTSGGTCEVRINGIAVLTVTGVTNAVNVNGGTVAVFCSVNPSGCYLRDFYVLDTTSGSNVGYLGDLAVVELFGDGPGVNSAWTPNVGPFSITSVANASGGNTVYTGAITGGASNTYLGYNFLPSGFAHSQNNTGGSNPAFFECVASTATTITLNNPSGVSDTTGSIAFQCIVQAGINQTGTRPNADVTYISDATTGDISDFVHTPLVLTGIVFGVVHQSYLRKDDLGTRQVAQVCLSGGSTEQGATISVGNSYQYYQDVLEVDPNTSTQFSISGLNAASFGIKEIT